jgi:DNA invertase Pin-like site-specific DNA recombinase
MSHHGGDDLHLEGTGAAYLRVSTDEQDTERQYAAIRSFEARHGVAIARTFWFKDEGWARDQADRRPDFQRLMKLVEAGRVQWIVVDRLDRFGMKSAKQLFAYLLRLEEAGCKLYDTSGKEWTGEDDGTEITAWVEGKNSAREQREKSHRVLGGKVEKARAGEWQGGPVRLGFDVACYDREKGEELWRVLFEGRSKRLKVYPDGRTERFDGRANFPKFQEKTQVLRVAPSNDKAKVAAAVSVFKRYGAEAVSFTALAHHLNRLGFRNSYGGLFQGHHVKSMLEDPVYLGYYTYNRRHSGKFHRWANGQTVLEVNYEEKQSKNDRADWVQSRRLFEPLVDRATWDAVQRKLDGQSKRARAPRAASLYLSGLVYCGNCGGKMVSGPCRKPTRKPRKDGHTGNRHEYFCGTYHKAAREGRRSECKCLRNGVFQDVLEEYVNRYLAQTGKRLEVLTKGWDADPMTGRLRTEQDTHWQSYLDGIRRLKEYLAKFCPDDYDALLREEHEARAEYDAVLDAVEAGEWQGVDPADLAACLAGPEGEAALADAKRQERPTPFLPTFLEDCISVYRKRFDPAALEDEITKLDAEYTRQMDRWAGLTLQLARKKVEARLKELDDRIAELRRQQEDVAALVERHHQEVHDLAAAIADAERAMQSEDGERAMRQRAEALRGVIQRIECTFTATGQTGAGWGKKNSKLVKVTCYPVVGDPVEFSMVSKGTLLYSSAHSCM